MTLPVLIARRAAEGKDDGSTGGESNRVAPTWSKGARVDVDFDGDWFKGEIVSVRLRKHSGAMYNVSYVLDGTFERNVAEDRIRPLTEGSKGRMICHICGTEKNKDDFSVNVQKGRYGKFMTQPFCLEHSAGDQRNWVSKLIQMGQDNDFLPNDDADGDYDDCNETDDDAGAAGGGQGATKVRGGHDSSDSDSNGSDEEDGVHTSKKQRRRRIISEDDDDDEEEEDEEDANEDDGEDAGDNAGDEGENEEDGEEDEGGGDMEEDAVETSGYGVTEFSNGDIYKGGSQDGRFHGLGTFTWANGQEYRGEWEGGCYQGQGTMTLESGQRYMGAWSKGVRHGLGRAEWPSSGMNHSVAEIWFRGSDAAGGGGGGEGGGGSDAHERLSTTTLESTPDLVFEGHWVNNVPSRGTFTSIQGGWTKEYRGDNLVDCWAEEGEEPI